MWLVFFLLAIAGFQVLSMLVERDQLKQFDHAIISTVQGWENDTLTKIAKFLELIGSSAVLIPGLLVLSIILFIYLKHRKELVLLIGGMLGSTLLNHALKDIYKRARPDIHRLAEQAGYSYPSGHSMAAFTFYFLITYLLWRHIHLRRWRIVLLLFSACMIVCIGLSRVYLGVHYPSDVLAGYWVSACWVALCIRLFRAFARTRK
ncbi:phosphatase PAP2 family protein [Paenibacillus sp. OV219]|uniref:phosphatase PAP2 family protein n=1 Tax=Paenibacillus sp. OV219 TaxID=1884377 RepID=UPI0008AE5389|nr:phosphatase PAP2 family protein [Paenibacillus sp. OV219]SEO61360.1 undecaprenyl-diphosphatase [Paenibacillus sp. OV219]